jgi:hypothetical protein
MLAIRYLRTYEIQADSSGVFEERFLNAIASDLKRIESFVELNKNSISFTRKVNITPQGNSKIFRVMRKGKVFLERNDNSIIVESYVELQEHLFFSFILSLLTSFALGYNVNFDEIFMVYTSLVSTVIYFLLGYIKVKLQIDDLVKSNLSKIGCTKIK